MTVHKRRWKLINPQRSCIMRSLLSQSINHYISLVRDMRNSDLFRNISVSLPIRAYITCTCEKFHYFKQSEAHTTVLLSKSQTWRRPFSKANNSTHIESLSFKPTENSNNHISCKSRKTPPTPKDLLPSTNHKQVHQIAISNARKLF